MIHMYMHNKQSHRSNNLATPWWGILPKVIHYMFDSYLLWNSGWSQNSQFNKQSGVVRCSMKLYKKQKPENIGYENTMQTQTLIMLSQLISIIILFCIDLSSSESCLRTASSTISTRTILASRDAFKVSLCYSLILLVSLKYTLYDSPTHLNLFSIKSGGLPTLSRHTQAQTLIEWHEYLSNVFLGISG